MTDDDKQKLIDLFRQQYGKDPIKSKDCSGCVSWPWAMCWACTEANFGKWPYAKTNWK